MESGFLQASGLRILWTPKKHKLFILPRGDGKDILLADFTSVEAHCCRACGFILTPMPSNAPENE
jgi:hypothetical protein